MDEGSGVVPRRRVDDHAGGLVDDRDVVVLVNDVQRDLLRAGLHDIRLGDLEVDDVSGSHAVRRVGGVTVDQDEVTLDEPRGRGAAQLWGLLGEKAIEPRRRRRGGQPTGFRRRRYPAIISTTPIEIAASATLKTGQKWKLMKSVTVPFVTRSNPLPSVPPRIRPRTTLVQSLIGLRAT